jgi:tripartite-type tricarboxylate transporter receptor subunit TctC
LHSFKAASIAESGLPGYDFSTWYALLTHANVRKPALALLHAAAVKALSQPDFKARLANPASRPAAHRPPSRPPTSHPRSPSGIRL